nr:Dabb family protein [Alteromonas macleodii]
MTDTKRRQFLATAGALASLSALPASAQATPRASAELPPILHMVYFWLKDTTSTEDKQKLIDGLQSLRAIPQVHSLHIGVPANTLKRDVIDNSFDVSELMFFESVEAQDEYQLHPIHKKFIEDCAHL